MGNTVSYQIAKPDRECHGRNAICILELKNGIKGLIEFHQCSVYSPVTVRMNLQGGGQKTHAIHIHEFGDTRDGCASLGAHWNPYRDTHGSKDYDMPRHAGDLCNNITFNSNGVFKFMYNDDLLTLFSPESQDLSIVGRSIVIHEQPDDLGRGNNAESLISGNAGNRIHCGIIAVSKLYHF